MTAPHRKRSSAKAGPMKQRLSETVLFFNEFFRTHHTTGAVLPSGRFLASCLVRYVRQYPGPKRVLEVGPGTGAVTRKIVASLGPEDSLDLVELNEKFVTCLRRGFEQDPVLKKAGPRAQVLHCAVQDLPETPRYDVIVSGLPLNNFSPELVEDILSKLTRLANPGGTLSFFEYIAIRAMRSVVSGPKERRRLRGIRDAMKAVLDGREIRRDWVWPNVPPAWVHHVRFDTEPAVSVSR